MSIRFEVNMCQFEGTRYLQIQQLYNIQHMHYDFKLSIKRFIGKSTIHRNVLMESYQDIQFLTYLSLNGIPRYARHSCTFLIL